MLDFIKLRIYNQELINRVFLHPDFVKCIPKTYYYYSKYQKEIQKKLQLDFHKINDFNEFDYVDVCISPHYHFNNYLHNGNDLTPENCIKSIFEILDYLQIKSYELNELKVVNLEVGVNIIPETDVKELINGIYYSKKTPFMVSDSKIPNYRRTEEKDSEYKIIYQAELAYLLAQQFTATSDTLGNILTSIDDAANVFYVGAMLEMSPESGFIKAGMKLFPAGIKKHRLYLMTRSGKEAGYISFKDDRLYYVLIPILEQKRAMVKIEVSSKQDRHNTMGEKKYKNIDLWVKIGNDATFPENINMRIEDLLNSYHESK